MVVDHSCDSESEPEAEVRDEFGLDPYINDIYAYMRAKEVKRIPFSESFLEEAFNFNVVSI